ncbi:MAG: sugar phosphate isomerase/epimerase [Hydrogenoanaerobacterium sp.]
MKTGVSTACLYPMETELSLRILAEQGIDTVEIFINAPSELEPEYLNALRGILKKYSIKVTALHPYTSGFEPFLFFTNYRRRFCDGLKIYEDFYKAAVFLDAPIFVLHGDHHRSLLTDEEYFERYGEMFLHAKKHGVILAQENVERCRSRSACFIQKMYKALGENVRFVLDIKQALRSDETAFTMLEAMGNAVCYLHLSDSTDENDCVPPGQGSFDFTELYNRLKPVCGDVCGMIELYRQSYKTPDELYASYSFLKAIR